MAMETPHFRRRASACIEAKDALALHRSIAAFASDKAERGFYMKSMCFSCKLSIFDPIPGHLPFGISSIMAGPCSGSRHIYGGSGILVIPWLAAWKNTSYSTIYSSIIYTYIYIYICIHAYRIYEYIYIYIYNM